MACLRPLEVENRYGGKSLVPCGHCVNCTIKKIQELKVFAMAEYAQNANKNLSSSFIRLSYNDVNLPVIYKGELKRLGELVQDGKVPTDFLPTLLKTDFQKFMKRLRILIQRKYDGRKIKYIYCGEYGEHSTHRSHYHLILFGLSYKEAEFLIKQCWKLGFCDYKPFEAGAVSYIAKYMFHDVYGKQREEKYTSKGVEPPFLYHSTNLGKKYLRQFEEAGTIKLNGRYWSFPKYYAKKYNIKKQMYTKDELEKFEKEGIIKAKDYVNLSRQRGVAVDSTSLNYIPDVQIPTRKFNYKEFIQNYEN